MRIPLIIHKNAPLANVCSLSGTFLIGMGVYFCHDMLLIGILMLVAGFILLWISHIIASKERKKSNGAKYILNKDGTYTCRDCDNIINELPCPFCQKKAEEHMLSLENNIPCKNCGAFVNPNSDVCHVCGEKINIQNNS